MSLLKGLEARAGAILRSVHFDAVATITRDVLTEEKSAMGGNVSATGYVGRNVPCCVVSIRQPAENLVGAQYESVYREVCYLPEETGRLVLPGDTITVDGTRTYAVVQGDDNHPSAGGIVGVHVVRKS